MTTQAGGQKLEKRRATALGRPLNRFAHRTPDREHVVSVDPYGRNPIGGSLLGKRAGRGLLRGR